MSKLIKIARGGFGHLAGPLVLVLSQIGIWVVILSAPKLLEPTEVSIVLALIATTQTLGSLCDLGLTNAVVPSLLSADRREVNSTISAMTSIKFVAALVVGIPALFISMKAVPNFHTLIFGIALLIVNTLRAPLIYVSNGWTIPILVGELISLAAGLLIMVAVASGLIVPLLGISLAVIVLRASSVLVALRAFQSTGEAFGRVTQTLKEIPPYAAHRLLTTGSHYSTSVFVIAVNGPLTLSSYLFAERMFYAGLALCAMTVPMFLTLRKAVDNGKYRTKTITSAVVVGSTLLAVGGGIAMTVISRLILPDQSAEVSTIFLAFIFSLPVISVNYYIGSFFLQPDRKSTLIANSALVSFIANSIYILTVYLCGSDPMLYAFSPLFAESACLVAILIGMRGRLTLEAVARSGDA